MMSLLMAAVAVDVALLASIFFGTVSRLGVA